MTKVKLFTSESVSEGHPDKIADQISDAILDAIIEQDSKCRVACETLVKTGMVIISGEITTNAWVDIEQVTRNTVKEIGYTSSDIGFDGDSCAVITAINKQSSDIALGVDNQNEEMIGAGDQGMVFGYATNEISCLMPAPIVYAHKLMERQAELRKNGILPWLRPDAKSQITLKYQDNKPISVDTVVFSTQHDPKITQSDLKEAIIEEIIKPILPEEWVNIQTRYLVNPTGRFVIGGPLGDCGLTGRKIIVDSYGGMARHGGGCFSGKDPTKIDRSAAYGARYIAKNLVAAGIVDRCEIQISYAIGIAYPVSISIETFNTSKISEIHLIEVIKGCFDLRPGYLIKDLNLQTPIYKRTASYGHFGRENCDFSWEKIDKVELLRHRLGI